MRSADAQSLASLLGHAQCHQVRWHEEACWKSSCSSTRWAMNPGRARRARSPRQIRQRYTDCRQSRGVELGGGTAPGASAAPSADASACDSSYPTVPYTICARPATQPTIERDTQGGKAQHHGTAPAAASNAAGGPPKDAVGVYAAAGASAWQQSCQTGMSCTGRPPGRRAAARLQLCGQRLVERLRAAQKVHERAAHLRAKGTQQIMLRAGVSQACLTTA